ncbi:MAG: ABC transporter permease [archaeon]|nr:ABC transporter permease [archaeon]
MSRVSRVASEITALSKRELRKWYRSPFLVFMMIIQPVMWMGLFGQAFNLTGFVRIPDDIVSQLPPNIASQLSNIFNRIMTDFFGTANIDYFSYMAVGMLSVVVLFTSMFSGWSTAWDRRLGFLSKLLVAPIKRGSIVLSKVLSSVVRALAQAMLVLLIAFTFGFKANPAGIIEVLLAFVALFLLALGLSSLFISLTIKVRSWESQMAVLNLLNLPMTFASSALYPIKLMPAWLQTVASLNPLSYAVDAIRQAFLMGSAVDHAALFFNLEVLALFAAIFTFIGIFVAGSSLREG